METLETINKYYFTPDISDIRVGYEYEELTGNPQDDISISEAKWERRKFPDPFTGGDVLKLKGRNIRVPYLTREQIESEGWQDVTNILGHPQYSKPPFRLYPQKNNKICIYDMFDNVYFVGECKDVNTLRYICKLLGI